MTATRELLVLGAGYAGLRCAMRLGWREPQATIIVVDPRETQCERVRLHQVAAGQNLPARPLAALCREAGIGFRRARALRIDAERRVVETDAGSLRYDRLVLALGSSTDLRTPGAADHCDRVGDEVGARTLARRLASLPTCATVLVVGGGLTGIETVTELAESWSALRFMLVTRGVLGPGLLGARGLARVRGALARLGVQVREHFDVRRVEQDRLCGADESLAFDVCVWTPGFRAPSLARDSGLRVDAANRLLVDATLRCAEHPEIYGIGDAAIPDAPLAPMLMSCRLALPMAACAADNLARERRGNALIGFVAKDAGRCISLGRDDGVLQFHHGDGRLRSAGLGGGAAAWAKERICRYTVWIIDREARASGSARGVTAALPAAAVGR